MNSIREYKNENDYELLYLISENNEDANDLIFKKYEPVIDFYVKKYLPIVVNKGIDYNDLYQEGLIGLDSAIKSYKEKKEIKFSTFAFVCIKRRILSAIKLASRKKHSILNESYSIDDNINCDDITYEDVISSGDYTIEDSLINKEMYEIFSKKLNINLSDFEMEVYKLRVDGFSYKEIANKLNKTLKSIEGTVSRIKNKINQILEEMD